MADADLSESETTDFPVLIGCSFFHTTRLAFHLLLCCFSLARRHLYAHTRMHIYPHTHKNMAAVGGCQPVRVLDVM